MESTAIPGGLQGRQMQPLLGTWCHWWVIKTKTAELSSFYFSLANNLPRTRYKCMVSSLSCASSASWNSCLQPLLHSSQPHSRPFPLSVPQASCGFSKNTPPRIRESPPGVDQLHSPVCGLQGSLLLFVWKREAVVAWAKFPASISPFHLGPSFIVTDYSLAFPS